MKHFTIPKAALAFLIYCLAAVGLFGEEAATPTAEERHDALLALARDENADFQTALDEAKASGMAASWLLEAKLARAFVTGDFDALFALMPELEDVGDDFRFGFGRVFISEGQLAGFADALRSLQAYQQDDMETFERFAISSYDKAPDFNKAFGIGDLLTRYRYQQAQEVVMASRGVPMDTTILTSVEGEARPLGEWVGDNKAVLLDFWASWCGPCIRLMPALREKSAVLADQGVFVAGVNTDDEDQQSKAVKVREQRDMASVPWLLDANGGDLSSYLMIDSIPRMVLISPEGKILFNGHPMDEGLGVALGKLGVTLPEAH